MPILPLPAAPDRAYTPRYGADVSFYLPTSGRVRRLFGDNWMGIGPAFRPVQIARRSAIRPDINILSQRENGNRAFLVFVGGEYITALSRPTGYFLPYAGAGANLLYGRGRVQDDSFSRLTVATSAFIGTRLGRNAYTEIRYRLAPDIEGLNFSGTSITLGIRF